MKKFPLMRTTTNANFKDLRVTFINPQPYLPTVSDGVQVKPTGITCKGKFYPCDDKGHVKDLVIEPYQPYQIETE